MYRGSGVSADLTESQLVLQGALEQDAYGRNLELGTNDEALVPPSCPVTPTAVGDHPI